MVREALRGITESTEVVRFIREQVAGFEADAHTILGRHEASSKSRVITLDQSRRKLQGLSLRQQDLLVEALDCVEHGLFRAAHVSAWQAFMDLLQEKLASDGLVKVKAARIGWAKFATMDDLREEISEFQFVEVAKAVALVSRGEMKTLHGMLSTRTQCAHPSQYRPGLNEALGYVSDLISRMGQLQTKTL